MSLKKQYLNEIAADLARHPVRPRGTFSEADLAGLPEPVGRYLRHCGFVGRPKMTNARLDWAGVRLLPAPGGTWMDIDCHQYNAVDEPTRIVYMCRRVLGFPLFEGRDKFQDGEGSMLIRLLKWAPLGDARGWEMDESALVTVLAETLLAPTCTLQPYLQWEAAADPQTARAAIAFKGIRASGTFFFNAAGEMTRFTTNDRYRAEKNGAYRRLPWSVYVDGYAERDGLRFPAHLRAVWHAEDGDLEYFRGRITRVTYDVEAVNG